MHNCLQIFSAGVARKLVEQTITRWNTLHPEISAELTVAGSVDLIRNYLSGNSCDLLIVADDTILDSMMLPEHADGYIVFAGNQLVIAANAGYEIRSDNWKETLLAPDATFDHHNPYADPGGYRAVMAMKLADYVEPGLADKLLNHPGHYGMGNDPEILPEIRYSFDYYSRALARNASIAKLPEVMNLSSDALAETYAEATFQIDDTQTVSGTPIRHALTIPAKTAHAAEAKEFARLFLENDFEKNGFIPKHRIVGSSILD